MRRSARVLVCLVIGMALIVLAGHRALAADSAVVLVYQRIGEAARHPDSSVTLPQFEAHLAMFAGGKYHVRALPEIFAAFDAGTPLPDRTVAITFDNGFASVAREAWPRLKALGLPFAVFIATDAIDAAEPGQMDWPTLRALAADGVIIGTRGAANRPLWRRGEQERRADLERAIERIRAEIGQAPAFLAYPDGEYDSSVAALARALGFKAAFALASGPIHAGSDRFALPRFELSETYAAAERVALVASSLPLPISAIDPDGPVLQRSPETVSFIVEEGAGTLAALTCFQSRVGPVAHVVDAARRVQVTLGTSLTPGHNNRVNCTLPAGDGRVRWLGLQYVMP